MSDLIMVSLPREEVQRIMKGHTAFAKSRRKDALLTETHAPKTKRNASAVDKMIAEALASEDIASLCSHALSNADDMTHMGSDADLTGGSPFSVTLADQIEADARSNDALDAALEADPPRVGIDHEFYDDPSMPS